MSAGLCPNCRTPWSGVDGCYECGSVPGTQTPLCYERVAHAETKAKLVVAHVDVQRLQDERKERDRLLRIAEGAMRCVLNAIKDPLERIANSRKAEDQ